jgi:hypothetical protein
VPATNSPAAAAASAQKRTVVDRKLIVRLTSSMDDFVTVSVG